MVTMDTIYVLRVFMLMTSSSVVLSQWPPPPPPPPSILEGCTEDVDLDECKIKYNCRNNVDSPETFNYYYQQYENSDCRTRTNDNLDYPIHLRFEIVNFESMIPTINNDYYGNRRSKFVELDISSQDLTHIPSIISMDNLKLLNMSHNSLTEAKLCNNENLPSLIEIDYSFNQINIIEVSQESCYTNLKILNISHNQIENIPNSLFDIFWNMEYLDISYNFISTVNFLTFEGLKNLLYLNLSHNKITDINLCLLRFNKLEKLDLSFNELSSLTRNSIENLKQLKYMNLSNNEIDNIQFGAFENMTSLISLDLSHNKLSDLYKDMFQHNSQLSSINLSWNHIRTLPTLLFINNLITEFWMKDNNLEGILSTGTFGGMELVTDLDLSYQNYTTIEDLAFNGMKSLNKLFLNNNAIITLGKLCFKSLSSLTILNLSLNRIISIDFDKSDLFNLRELYLQNNHISDLIPDYFTNLQKLDYVDISHNKIKKLHPHSFIYLSNVKHIFIRSNPIDGNLEDGTFNGLSLLPNLDISNTYITAISNNSFKGMSELKDLNISHCKVSELQYNAFENTGAIEVLDLSFNELIKFEVNCSALINLNQLLLNNNILIFVSPTTLRNLPRINKLVISHNDIQLLKKDVFENSKDLRYLDVSFNTALQFDSRALNMCPLLVDLFLSSIKTSVNFTDLTKDVVISHLHVSNAEIKNLSALSLDKLRHLEELSLDHNQISNVRKGDFCNVTSLRMLDLSYNGISFIQPGAFKDNVLLYTLNISHNNLLSVSYGIFRGLNYLSVIDFSYNAIESLEHERFYDVSSLTELYVDHNNIKTFNIAEFTRTNLQILSIGDNPIPCNMLVNINKMGLAINVTAVHKDENNYENVNGITCNENHETNKDYSIDTNNINDRILTEIKKILQNMTTIYDKDKYRYDSSGNDKITEYISNLDEKVSRSYVYLNSTVDILRNLMLNFANENKNMYQMLNNTHSKDSGIINTNILLNKILAAITSYKRTTPLIEFKNIDTNGSKENVVSHINTIKLDLLKLQEQIAKEHESILSEVDKKLASLNTSKLMLSDAHSEKHSNINEISHSTSLTFVEICLGLMLSILVGFIIFKIYTKISSVVPIQTYSTRNLPEALDNSTL